LMDMLLIFLWLLADTLNSTSSAEQETLCTNSTCFTVHMVKVSFEVARQSCEHSGGYLMIVRDEEEENVLRCLLSKIRRQHQERAKTFWIGLKLHKGDCVLADEALRGFRWISGEDSSYSNWKKEPVRTCTSEKCVSVLHTSSEKQLKWTAGQCALSRFYVCKFYFQGMCKSLTLMGSGQVSYTAPFSDKPQSYKMQLLPFGTYAEISCSNQQSQSSVCRETEHGYQWTDPGPFCKAEEQNCMIHNGGCEHLCQQEAGGVQCYCKEGYSLEEDGFSCRSAETDECEQLRCHHGCSNHSGSLSCCCEQGFSLSEDGRSCVDINKCDNGVCQIRCVNNEGSLWCTCYSNYYITKELLDSCVISAEGCLTGPCEHVCTDVKGGFTCSCFAGFIPDRKDPKRCKLHCAQKKCPAVCDVETGGSCYCPEGFIREDNFCHDFDECFTQGCDHVCHNTYGSFKCSC
uniref:Thrombomodulin n=1 Tax=Tetraodon nigroviridis TaxID=99883 RepID=H3CU14_TETNG